VTKYEFKRLRESIKYTQARLSEEMEVTIRTLTRWENGEVEIPKMAELALRFIAAKMKKHGDR
jgi:DNA-binding transcriptional regulator YiaG